MLSLWTSPSSPALHAEHDSHSVGYPRGHWGSAVLAVPPSSPLCTPAGVGWDAGQPLALCEHFSAVNHNSYHTVSSTNPRHSPILLTVRKINSTPVKTSTHRNNLSGTKCMIQFDYTRTCRIWLLLLKKRLSRHQRQRIDRKKSQTTIYTFPHLLKYSIMLRYCYFPTFI